MLLPTILFTALSCPVQGDSIPGYRLYANASTWASPEPSGNFQALQTGRLFRADQRDLINLKGSGVYVLQGVDTRDSVVCPSTGASGILILPGQGTGGLDALLIADAGGASLWTVGTGGTLSGTVQPQLSGWGGASMLRLGEGGKIFARGAAHNTILRASVSGGVLSADTTLSVPGPIRDFEVFHWDTDPVLDLAVVTDTQLIVRSTANWSGNLVNPNYTVTPNDLLAVSHGTGGERDLLLWYSELAGVGSLAAGNSSRIDPVLNLNTTIGNMECFRFGRENVSSTREDVFLSLRTSRDVVQLQRLAPQPVGNYSFWLPIYTSGGVAPYRVRNADDSLPIPTPFVSTLTCAFDADGDGDDDIVSALHDRSQIQVLLNTRYERFDTVGPDVIPLGLEAPPDYNFPWIGKFEYRRRNPLATHLRLEIRRQPGGSTFNPAVVPDWVLGTGSTSAGTWDIQLPPPGLEVEEGQLFAFELTGLYQSASGATGIVSPGDLLQFTLYEVKVSSTTTRYPAVTYFQSYFTSTEAAYRALPEISQYLPAPMVYSGPTQGHGHAQGSSAPTGSVTRSTGSFGSTTHDFASGTGGTVIGGRGLGGGP